MLCPISFRTAAHASVDALSALSLPHLAIALSSPALPPQRLYTSSFSHELITSPLIIPALTTLLCNSAVTTMSTLVVPGSNLSANARVYAHDASCGPAPRAGAGLVGLPTELLVKVMLELDWHSVLRLQLVSNLLC